MHPLPVYAKQLDAIEVSVQALRGNEVIIVVLSYRNPRFSRKASCS